MSLVFKLLEYFERKDGTKVERHTDVHIEGYEDRLVWYHLNIMYQAQLIDGERNISKTSDRLISVFPAALTWDGHEFLAAKRNATVWKKLTKRVGSELSNLPFGVLKSLLFAELKSHFGVEVSA